MFIQPLLESHSDHNSSGPCTATRGMARERAVELAHMDGRAPHAASKQDWEQAKRELSDGAFDSDYCDQIAGSAGYIVTVPSNYEEGDEGPSFG